MADAVEAVVFVLRVSRRLMEETPLATALQEFTRHAGGFHTLLGNSFKSVCERKTAMLYKELLHLGF